MDVSALADRKPAVAGGLPFIFNPWKLKEIRRLYVNLPDGTKAGYLDLVNPSQRVRHLRSGRPARRPAVPDRDPAPWTFWPSARTALNSSLPS
jgi:hypothetical protein